MEKRLAKQSKVLTREQAAERLFVCPNTISSYIKSGRLKNRGVGRKVLLFESWHGLCFLLGTPKPTNKSGSI